MYIDIQDDYPYRVFLTYVPNGKGIFKQQFGGAFAWQNLIYIDICLCRSFYEFQKDLAKRSGSAPVSQLQHQNHIQVPALC